MKTSAYALWNEIVAELTFGQFEKTMGLFSYREKAKAVLKVTKSKRLRKKANDLLNLVNVLEMAEELNIEIIHNTPYLDRLRSIIGIHLFKPDVRTLENAIITAERDGFPAIIIHTCERRAA